MRHAIIRKSDGKVVNSVDLVPGTLFEVDPVNFELVEGDWPIGWIWDGTTATDPQDDPAVILERKNALAASEADLVLGEIQRRAMNLLFSLAKANTPSLTLQQFVNAFEGTLGNEPITRQMFIEYIRDNRL